MIFEMENKGLLFLGSVYDVINGDVATTTRSLAGLGDSKTTPPTHDTSD